MKKLLRATIYVDFLITSPNDIIKMRKQLNTYLNTLKKDKNYQEVEVGEISAVLNDPPISYNHQIKPIDVYKTEYKFEGPR